MHIINIFNGNKQLLGIDEPTAAFVFVDLSFNNWIYKKIIMAKVVVTTKDGLDCLSDPFFFSFFKIANFYLLKKINKYIQLTWDKVHSCKEQSCTISDHS